jgi:hypothetical protein
MGHDEDTGAVVRERTQLRVAVLIVLVCLIAGSTWAQQDSVLGTLHNLSTSGPGEVRALDETEVCKFCHIPHNAVAPVPLWSHELSETQYEMPAPRGSQAASRSHQPDGSSRLCLSCHDGTVALGKVAGEPREIAMSGPGRLGPGRRGYLGTDLSGSHPISFVVRDDVARERVIESDMGLRSLTLITGDREVRLDGQGKMQCTTCHDPHSDRHYQEGLVPRFWVSSTVDGVCLKCHELR